MARRPLIQRLQRAWREIAPPPRRASARSAIYSGAQFGRLFSDWIASVMSPDDETRGSLRTLRGRARELDRNNGLAHHFFDLLEILVVGPTGPQLSAQVRTSDGTLAKPINKKIEAAWYRWAEGPVTFDETLDCVGFQKLLIRTAAMDGEAFVRIHRDPGLNEFGFAFEPIDADLVDEQFSQSRRGGENEVRMGVEVDARGRRVAYYLRDPDGRTGGSQARVRVPATDMFSIFIPRRPNQTRGVTWLAPSMYALRQHGAYTEAELVGSRIGSSKMGFYTQAATDPLGGGDVEPGDAETEENEGTGEGEFRSEVEPGMFSKLPAGYQFQAFDPQHPTTAYGEFTKNIVRQIASGLSVVSYESLSNDRESTTYSSSRTGLLLERDAIKSLHAWWRFWALRRIHREWLNQALLTGQLDVGTRDMRPFVDVKWIPPGRDWVDPMKEVQSAVIAVNNGLGSRTQYLTEKGLDRDEVFEELAAEQAKAKELGISVTAPEPNAAPPPSEETDDGDAPAKPKPRARVLAAINGNGHSNGARG